MALQLTTFDVADYLDSEEALAEYLSQVMADGDDDEFLRALGHVAKTRGMSQLAKDAGVGRESLYKALKPGATPGYATVGKVVRALGFRMAVEPATRQKAAAAGKKPAKPAKPKTLAAVTATKKAKSAAAGAERLKGTRARA